MIEIAPYKASHAFDIICDQVRETESWFKTCPQAGQLMKEKEQGEAWTVLEDGVPIACAGFYRYAGHTAEAWYLMSPGAKRHIKGIMVICKNSIDTFLEDSGITHLVAHVLEEDAGGHAWARYMGFKRTDIHIPDGGHMYVKYQRVVE